MDSLISPVKEHLSSATNTALFFYFVAAFVVYNLLIIFYNLILHPLAGFPGPKVAAATRLYEFYYDVVKRGQYIYKIEEMHRKYGTKPDLRSTLKQQILIFQRSNHSYQPV